MRLARAEHAIQARDLARRALPGVLALAAALTLAVIGLLLPWSREDGIVRDAFSYSAGLVFLALLAAAGGAVALAWYAAEPSLARGNAVRAVTLPCGSLSMIVGLAVTNHVDANYRQWWGPGLFEGAMLAAMLLTALINVDESGESRRAPGESASAAAASARMRTELGSRTRLVHGVLAVLGLGGLGLAAAGLTTSWQQMTGHIVNRLVGHPLVWRGTELASTHALRWTIAGGLAASLLVAAVRSLRRLLPVLLVAGGTIVIVLTIRATADIPLRGTSVAIGVSLGARLTLAGGIVAAACGLMLGAAQWRRRAPAGSAVAIAVTAVVLASLAGYPIAHRAAAAVDAMDTGRGAPVLGPESNDDRRLGAPASTAAFDLYESPGPNTNPPLRPPIVARDLDGGTGTWFVRSLDRGDYLIEEVVRGRTLPVTRVTGPDELDLLGVADGRAVVNARRSSERFVSVVDLHDDVSNVEPSVGDDGELPQTVLSTAVYEPTQHRPGEVSGDNLQVELLADGSAAVTVTQATGPDRAYRVDAGTVRGTAPWALTTPASAASSRLSVHGPDGTSYAPSPYGSAPTAVVRTGTDGRAVAVLGGVSDRRCAPSRDPLSTYLADSGLPGSVGTTLVDRVGDLWLILGPDVDHGDDDLYVVTADGVFRKLPPAWHGAGDLRMAGDGSLFVTMRDDSKYAAGSTYRIADPPATARTATVLPPVPPGCVSDNRVPVTTAGVRAHAVGTVTLAGAEHTVVLDATGTLIQSIGPDDDASGPARWTLRRTVQGRKPSTIYSTTARIEDLEPDGHGGAWWVETPYESSSDTEGPSSIGHVDAAGAARIVARHVIPANVRAVDTELVADRRDGSAWWRYQNSPQWRRTTSDGHTTGTGYSLGTERITGFGSDEHHIYRETANGPGPTVLGSASGRGLSLPSALASHAPASDFSVDGRLEVTSDGRLLLYQGDYLARVERDGRVGLLSGPKDGLPQEDAVRSTLVTGNQLVIVTSAGTIYRMDVS